MDFTRNGHHHLVLIRIASSRRVAVVHCTHQTSVIIVNSRVCAISLKWIWRRDFYLILYIIRQETCKFSLAARDSRRAFCVYNQENEFYDFAALTTLLRDAQKKRERVEETEIEPSTKQNSEVLFSAFFGLHRKSPERKETPKKIRGPLHKIKQIERRKNKQLWLKPF